MRDKVPRPEIFPPIGRQATVESGREAWSSVSQVLFKTEFRASPTNQSMPRYTLWRLPFGVFATRDLGDVHCVRDAAHVQQYPLNAIVLSAHLSGNSKGHVRGESVAIEPNTISLRDVSGEWAMDFRHTRSLNLYIRHNDVGYVPQIHSAAIMFRRDRIIGDFLFRGMESLLYAAEKEDFPSAQIIQRGLIEATEQLLSDQLTRSDRDSETLTRARIERYIRSEVANPGFEAHHILDQFAISEYEMHRYLGARTPRDLITKHRMALALQFLSAQSGDLGADRMKWVAHSCGFQSLDAFMHDFACYFGFEPGSINAAEPISASPATPLSAQVFRATQWYMDFALKDQP